MTFLITGATGFIGRKLVAFLLAQGHAVNYLARNRSRDLDSRAAFHMWRATENPELDSVPRLDAVIHLAGERVAQRWSAEVKRKIYDSRVMRTRQLVGAITELRYKPSVLVSASAIGYYGNRGDEILTESSAPGSGFLADVCVAWEREAIRANEAGVRVVPIRIGAVLGEDGGAFPKMRRVFNAGLGGRFGSGSQWTSWIHVHDLVRLLVFAAENPSVAGVVNGTSPEPVTNATFTQALAKALHRPAFWVIPRFAMHLALGEMANVLFESIRARPQVAEQAGFKFRHATIEQTVAELTT